MCQRCEQTHTGYVLRQVTPVAMDVFQMTDFSNETLGHQDATFISKGYLESFHLVGECEPLLLSLQPFTFAGSPDTS